MRVKFTINYHSDSHLSPINNSKNNSPTHCKKKRICKLWTKTIIIKFEEIDRDICLFVLHLYVPLFICLFIINLVCFDSCTTT